MLILGWNYYQQLILLLQTRRQNQLKKLANIWLIGVIEKKPCLPIQSLFLLRFITLINIWYKALSLMNKLTEDELEQIDLQTIEEQGFEIINIIRLSKNKKA